MTERPRLLHCGRGLFALELGSVQGCNKAWNQSGHLLFVAPDRQTSQTGETESKPGRAEMLDLSIRQLDAKADFMNLRRIVSGAQTGVDRAALDVALELKIPCGGWVPKGRLDELGTIPPMYPSLQEADSPEPELRTELNVRDSDATLIMTHGALFGGSEYTALKAIELGKPHLHLDLDAVGDDEAVDQIIAWVNKTNPYVLNVAGPRQSDDRKIYERSKAILRGALSKLAAMNEHVAGAEDDLTVALALRDAALSDYRHWDIIRWQVPYWYCTLATAAAAVATFTADKGYELGVRIGCGTLAVFGLLCVALLANLIRYDARTIQRFNASLESLQLSAGRKSVLRIDRHFSFAFPAILTTASLYFIVFIVTLTIGFVVTAVRGMWWV